MPGAWRGGAAHGLLRAALQSRSCMPAQSGGCTTTPSLAVAAHHAAGHRAAAAALCALALERASQHPHQCLPAVAGRLMVVRSLCRSLHYFWSALAWRICGRGALPAAVVAAAAAVPAGRGQAAIHAVAVPTNPNTLPSWLTSWCWPSTRKFAVDGVALMQATAGGAA